MINFLKKIKDSRLQGIIDSVALGDAKAFERVKNQFLEYAPSFLWLLCYAKEETLINRKYIEENYKKFCQILDPDFPKIFASISNFESRMWEMILCDILSASGRLEPKGKDGADFLLKDDNDEYVQIEAVAPDESDDPSLRAIRPDYSKNKQFELSGNIEDLERPILLRVFDKGFIQKARRKNYDNQKPLIVAINSSKVVGLSSDDEYVLRRFLFGLGYITITRNSNGMSSYGFQQNASLNKPDKDKFEVAVFRNPDYKHISGVIYTSQQSMGFLPDSYSWHNSGITFVKNPMATHPVKTEFPFFKEIICNEEKYQRIDAKEKFKSVIDLD